jgi:hypothetical protein
LAQEQRGKIHVTGSEPKCCYKIWIFRGELFYSTSAPPAYNEQLPYEASMALSPKERERIIEEEQLRFETRQTLMREHCAKHRPSRCLWWVAVAALLVAAYCHFSCRGASCDWQRHGMDGKRCPYSQMAPGDKDAGVEPGQPLTPKN